MDQLDREVKRLTLTVEAQSLNRQSENNLIKAVVSDRLLVNLWTGTGKRARSPVQKVRRIVTSS